MASSPDAFKNRLVPLLSALGVKDPDTLDAVAAAFSEAIHDYITQDVEVAAGIPTPAGPTTGPGKLF